MQVLATFRRAGAGPEPAAVAVSSLHPASDAPPRAPTAPHTRARGTPPFAMNALADYGSDSESAGATPESVTGATDVPPAAAAAATPAAADTPSAAVVVVGGGGGGGGEGGGGGGGSDSADGAEETDNDGGGGNDDDDDDNQDNDNSDGNNNAADTTDANSEAQQPIAPVDPAVQAKVADFLAQQAERGTGSSSFTANLQCQKEFRNPYWLPRVVQHFGLIDVRHRRRRERRARLTGAVK